MPGILLRRAIRRESTMSVDVRDTEAKREQLRRDHLRPSSERPPSTARGVHHMALICSDPERTIRFYQEVLGFPLIEVMENRDYRGSTHFFHDVGNGNLLAFFDFPGLGLEPGVEAIGGVQHIAISVDADSFEAIRARVDAAGLPCIGPDRGLTSSIYVKDPDGIQIELLREPLLQMDERPLGE
jgi:glyoxylase I family protein